MSSNRYSRCRLYCLEMSAFHFQLATPTLAALKANPHCTQSVELAYTSCRVLLFEMFSSVYLSNVRLAWNCIPCCVQPCGSMLSCMHVGYLVKLQIGMHVIARNF